MSAKSHPVPRSFGGGGPTESYLVKVHLNIFQDLFSTVNG